MCVGIKHLHWEKLENVYSLGHFVLCWYFRTPLSTQCIFYVQRHCNHRYNWQYASTYDKSYSFTHTGNIICHQSSTLLMQHVLGHPVILFIIIHVQRYIMTCQDILHECCRHKCNAIFMVSDISCTCAHAYRLLVSVVTIPLDIENALFDIRKFLNIQALMWIALMSSLYHVETPLQVSN